jgi:Ca2+:H+ antiporter
MAVVASVMVVSVVAAVHHAEIVALKVGEPFGTLILAIAVTVIEVALILTIMLGGSGEAATLARDTAFAAVMIICNGIVGLCLLVGTIKHHTQLFKTKGAAGALGALTVLVTLTLVLPTFTTTTDGPTLSTPQLLFMALNALVLYGVFVFVQTIRHRHYFLPDEADEDGVPDPPSDRAGWTSMGLLVLCLVAVVGLAKVLSPTLTDAVDAVGAPVSSVGVLIALLVLAPETVAAVRAAAADRLQTSVNLAYGSGMASIGLTIPAIGVASLFIDTELELGLGPTEIVLLALTVATSIITVMLGRVTVLQGAIHLSVFSAFLFLAVAP